MFRKYIVKYVSALLVLFLVSTSFQATDVVSAADEYDELRNKWKAMLTGGTDYNPSHPYIASQIASIDAEAQVLWSTMNTAANRTCLWNDICSTTISSHIRHNYDRLKKMALAYATKGSTLENNTALFTDLSNALDWMYTNRYNESKVLYDNWWDWEIGAPLSLNDTVVLLYEDLTQNQVTNYMNAVYKFSPIVTKTGANRAWMSIVVGIRGIIVKDSNRIAAVSGGGLGPIFQYTTTSGDGFYRDGSFIQHERHAYTGGYGNSLLKEVSSLLYLLDGSTWEVTNPAHLNVFRWIYDSFEPVMYKGALMDMVRGREISRQYNQDHAAGHQVIQSVIRLAQVAPSADSKAFKEMVKHWIEEDTFRNFFEHAPIHMILLAEDIMQDPTINNRGELTKHQVFSSMDRTVHLRPGFGFGISMHSNRVYNYEVNNGENKRGWHTADGMTYLYNGDLSQYNEDYWPTINGYRMPGTTALRNTSVRQTHLSEKSWVGGVSLLGSYGATGMELAPTPAYHSLEAKKSWFMFDDEIVALGTDIVATDNKVVETTIENRKLNNNGNNALKVNGTTQPTALGWSGSLNGVQWAHLQGNVPGSDIGYYFPNAVNIQALREARTSSWSDINEQPTAPTHSITRNYMTMWVEHGVNPSNGKYAYVILPNKTDTQVGSYANDADIEVVQNNAIAQAVRETSLNILGVNFWQQGIVDHIKSNQPASVMTQVENNMLHIAVADPTHEQSLLRLEFSKPASHVVSKDPSVSVVSLQPLIIEVDVSGKKGVTQQLTVSLKNSAVTNIEPTDDAYVEDSGSGNTNFGQAQAIIVKNDLLSGRNRNGFLKFDISGINGRVASAKLKMRAKLVDYTVDSSMQLYAVANNSWQENTITWNNQPAMGNAITSINLDGGVNEQWYSVDVTDYIKTLQDQSLAAASIGLTRDAVGVALPRIYSKENIEALRPYLEVIVEETPELGTVDNSNSLIQYTGAWTHSNDSQYYLSTKSVSNAANSTATLSFTGSSVKIYAKKLAAGGRFDVYIDGVWDATVDTYNPADQFQVPVYQKTGLSNTAHTIQIRLAGQKHPNSSGYYVGLDYFSS